MYTNTKQILPRMYNIDSFLVQYIIIMFNLRFSHHQII